MIRHALVVEIQDIAEHPEMGRGGKVAPLREQAFGGLEPIAAAAPLETTGTRRDGKAHAAFDRLDAEMVEQRPQVRIRYRRRTDIDRDWGALIVDGNGMAVAARPRLTRRP
jgi:hypothetical protein